MKGNKDFFCSDLAWELGVPLVGTGTRGDTWFLVEYRGSWGAKAFDESTIPEEVKEFLQSFNIADNRVRILLIRQNESRTKEALSFFVGRTSALNPKLHRFEIENYADILKLDLESTLSSKNGNYSGKLYLVCTNGRRDKCCAVYGPEVYQAMTAEAGNAVWQSSHIAGHNQAPVMLFFPHGVNYAHATPSEARRLIRSYQKEQVILHHYRGRVCYENHLQAAEHFWREQTGVIDLPGLVIESDKQIGADQWEVSIRGLNSGKSETIYLVRRRSAYSIPITCTKKKESPIFTFHRSS